MAAMVFTLQRYIFAELMKVFVLATIALTLMLTLGLLIQNVQEFGVGPEQAIHLLGYLIPITLTFVLPMGALFASALIYGRFASDNELNACRASGVSLTTLIYPGLCLAIAVATTTLILSFHVVPSFVLRAEKSLKSNFKQILFRNVQRKGYYTLPGKRYRLYADTAYPEEDMLSGVIVTDSKKGRITKIITAETARVEIDTHRSFNEVRVAALEAYQISPLGQDYSKELAFSNRAPSLLSDSVKFQKMDRIKKIKQDMTEYYPIGEIARGVQAQLAIEMLSEQVAARISAEEKPYYSLSNEDITIRFTAGDCQVKTSTQNPTIELVGPIRLDVVSNIFGKRMYLYDSNRGQIRLEDESIDAELILILYDADWLREDGVKYVAPRRVFRNLILPENITASLGRLGSVGNDGFFASVLKNPPSGKLAGLRKELLRKCSVTTNEINAEIHSRLVFGIGCIALTLVSIALGIMFRGGHLLSAFGASSIPAGALTVCIMAGKDLTKNIATSASVGISVMWAGLLALSILTMIIYRKLLKT